MKRSKNREIARENLSIFETGGYESPNGHWVDISAPLQHAVEKTELIRPADFSTFEVQTAPSASELSIEVRNETTFQGAQRLREGEDSPVLALNFASAWSPGGGFLDGSPAQEEALCRGSALYPCLLPQEEYYAANYGDKPALYLDYMIYSPDVPVFRADNFDFLEKPWTVSFLTAPAPNAKAIMRNNPELLPEIPSVFDERIAKVLRFASHKGYRRLVLGAWGCGAFRNDTKMVAGLFRRHLLENPEFSGAFSEIVFSVLDRKDDGTFATFVEELG